MKIRVTGSSSYEKEQDGIVVESRIYSPPPVETPEGKVWNGVLGKFLDESEANYPFEVDEKDTVFGEGHLAEWSAGDELAASLEEEDEDFDDEGEEDGDKEWRESALEVALNYLNDAKNDEINPNVFSKGWAVKKGKESGEKKQKKGKTEKKKVDEKQTKTAQDSLYEALVEDELPKDKTLAEHDKERHPDGFNPETDSCKFRDELKKETETDKGDEVDVNRGREEGIEIAKKEKPDSTGDAHKKKQLDIILDANPMTDDYHTGIRELSDIKTFAEACEDDPPANPDITEELVEDANNSGKIVVYSSYPIRNGTFVTPSRMMAKDYAGSGQVYSKEVPLEDVAWISGDEGQYAKVAESEESKPEPVTEPEQEKPADTSKVYEGLSKKKAEEYRNRMAKKRPDLDADLILTELGKIKDKKIQGDAFAWVMKGAIRLPEDLYKVEQARELATKAKRDPMQWDTPQACINELMGQGHKISEKPITVEELKKNPLMSDYRDEGFGVETFQVEDSREGQQLMRQVLNTHWGKDANPWCLLHGDGEGNLSDGINGEYDAWKFWQHYNALPKRVAFKDGKLLAFMATESQDDKSQDIYDEEEAVDELANDEKMQELIRADIGKEAQNKYGVTTIHFKFWVREKHDEELKKKISEIKRKRNIGKLPEEWWDRIDRPHRGIPIGETEVPNDKLHRIGEGEILKGELVVPQDQPMHIGTDGKPGYRLWEGGILKKEIRDNGDVVTFSKDEDGNVVPEEITCSDGSSYKYRNYGILIQAAKKVDDRDRNYAFYQNGDFAWVNIGFAELHYKDGKPSFLTSDLPIFEKDKMYMVSEIPNSNNEHLKRVLEILENAAKDGKELYKKGNSLFSSCIPDEGEAKTTQDELVSALMGDVVVEDAALPTKKTLQEHDKERHKGHFDPSTQTCKFREQMMVETDSDKADLVDSDVSGKGQETDSGSSNQPLVTPEEDKEYLEAVERGDMETAAKMVREVAGRAYPNTMVVGRDKYPEIVFHGSPTYGFTKFRPTNEMNFGIHLGDEVAAKERLQNIDELVGEDKPEGKPGIYKLYADITNPIVLPDVFLGIGDLGAYILNSRGEDSSFIDPDGILVGDTKPLSKEVFKDNAELENLKKVLNAVFGDGEYDGKKGFFEAKKYLQPAYVSYLQSLGYDGVIYDNRVENKGANSWVAFNPSQIKSADPVTWDDKGHVVPLSKRFDSGDDIRGDVSSGKKDDSARLDEEYMSAIDDDDTETAERVLRDAAAIAMPDTRVVDEDGKPKIVWHGTGAEFTQFKEKEVASKTRFIMDIGIHFGDEELAEKYARVPVNGRDGLGSGDRGTGSKMMPCFLDLKNPIDLRYRSKIDDAFANRMREIAGIGTRSKAWILKDVEPTELVQKAIEKDARAVRKAFDDFGYDGAVYTIANMGGAEAWMAFKPSQIKSAEIVTTGDDGEVIPVSRRFDGGNDIRGDVSGSATGDTESGDSTEQARDSEYLSAVKDGDMEKAAKMVGEAAMEYFGDVDEVCKYSPKELAVYDVHREDETEKELAEIYAGKPYLSIYKSYPYGRMSDMLESMRRREDGERRTGYVYLGLKRPFNLAEGVKSAEEIEEENGDIESYDEFGEMKKAYVKNFCDAMEAAGVDVDRNLISYNMSGSEYPDIDSIIDNVGGYKTFCDALRKLGYDGFLDDFLDTVHVIDPSAIKSAEPIEKDENGEVIPLSKRFPKKKQPSVSVDEKTVKDELYEALVEDSATLPQNQTLEQHDKQHHKGHFDPSTQTCKFREKMATETETDKADEVDEDRGGSEKKSSVTPEEDSEFAELASRIEGLMERNDKIPQEIKALQDKGLKREVSWDDFFKARKELNDEFARNNDSIAKLTKKIEKKFRQAAAKAFPNTKVVGKDGLPLMVFHGTVRPRKDMFTEFSDRPIFAFKREGLASQYTHSRRDMWVSPDRTGHVIPMVMNLENPLEIDAGKRLWSNIKVDWSDEPVDTEAICKYAKEHGHDGVIIHNVRDNMFDNDRASGDEYIAFSSNQVKDCGGIYTMEEGKGLSHDYEVLVSGAGNTKDDSGNVIPLSQRLDRTKKDIRYSMSDDGDEFGDSFYGEVYPDRKQSYSSEFGKDDAEDGEKASEAYRENFTKDGKYKSPFEGGKFNRAFLERAREGKGAETGEVWDDESRAAAEAAGRVLSGMLGGVTFELSDKPYDNSRSEEIRESIENEEFRDFDEKLEEERKKIEASGGLLLTAYHGTTSGGFSEFKRTNGGGFMFTPDRSKATEYSGGITDKVHFPTDEDLRKSARNELEYGWAAQLPSGEIVSLYNGSTTGILYEPDFDREEEDTERALNKAIEKGRIPSDSKLVRAKKLFGGRIYNRNEDIPIEDLEKVFLDYIRKPGIYDVVLRMEKPLIKDCKGAKWNEISVRGTELEEDTDEEYLDSRDFSDLAFDLGYDGVVLKNVRFSSEDGEATISDIYAVPNGKQIKLKSDKTYDNRGRQIALSERLNWDNSDVRFFRNSAGKVVGEYNRATNKITLYPGAKIKDVVHEYSHGLWQFAEQEAKAGRDGLQKKLHQIAHAAPEKVKEAVGRSYYDQDPNVVLEECFTHEMARRSEKNKAFADAIKTASGKKWYKKAWGAIKDTWKGLASKLGFNKADTSMIDDMTSGEAADYILTQMAQGKKFGNVSGEDDSSTETRMAKESSNSDTYVLPSGRKIPSAQKYLHTDTKGNPHDEMWSVFLEKQTGDGRVSQEFSDVVEGLFSGKDIDADTIKSLPEWKKAMEREKEIQKKLQETHGIDSTVKIQTEERERFRDAIIRAAMSDHISKTVPIEGTDSEFETNEGLKDGESYDVEKGRNICIVIGLPAAGKSTSFANPLAKKFKARLCDSDTIKKVLPEFNNGYGGNLVHEESTMLNEEILNRSIEQGDNIVYPILGYKPEKLENMFKMLRDKGYKINLCLKDMPANIAKGRLLGRFLSKGRYLPIECITKAQGKFADCFERVKGLVDAYVRATSDIDGSNERIIEKKGDLI